MTDLDKLLIVDQPPTPLQLAIQHIHVQNLAVGGHLGHPFESCPACAEFIRYRAEVMSSPDFADQDPEKSALSLLEAVRPGGYFSQQAKGDPNEGLSPRLPAH